MMTRTEKVLDKSIYSPLNHESRLLTRENFIENRDRFHPNGSRLIPSIARKGFYGGPSWQSARFFSEFFSSLTSRSVWFHQRYVVFISKSLVSLKKWGLSWEFRINFMSLPELETPRKLHFLCVKFLKFITSKPMSSKAPISLSLS